MTNKKITPGPWIKNGANGIHSINGYVVGVTYGSYMEGNALLASKAPELLQALTECIDFFENRTFPDYLTETVSNMAMNYSNLIKDLK